MSALKQDPAIAPQDIFTNSVTTQGIDLGARFTAGDGRVYRYSLGSATALVAGKAYQSLPQDTTNFQNLSPLAAGTSTFAITTSTTVTLAANQLTGGILTVRDGGGLGFTYKIKSHTGASSGTVTFTLEDPIQQGITTAAHIDVTPSPYTGLTVGTYTIVGVAAQNTAASSYGWVQTRGLCNVLCQGATTAGLAVSPSTTVAGALMASSGTQQVVGYAAITTVDAKYCPIFLTIE